MGRNRSFRRCSFSLFRGFSSKKKPIDPPNEFLCPISNSLMFDPVVVSSGHTFEHVCVNVCRNLGFEPLLPDGYAPDFATAIPNVALKSAIVNWCSESGMERPKPPVYSDVESIVRSLSGSEKEEDEKIRVWEREMLNGGSGKTPIMLLRADRALNRRNSCNCSSSDESEESVIANATELSRSSSPSISSEFFSVCSSSNYFSASSSLSTSEDENFVTQMNSLDVYEQEQAVILLRKTTRTEEESRRSLCTERLLPTLKQLLNSRYAAVQANAAAAVVNLSLEKCNKIKIVRAGIVPPLIEILKNGFDESRDHATAAIFSLAIDDNNKMAIGVLGALPPLLNLLRSGSRQCRRDAASALYHLTRIQSNRIKLIKLGAAEIFLRLLKDIDAAAEVVLVIGNLAECGEGRAALLYANAVEVLQEVAEKGSERARAKARQILVELSMRRPTAETEMDEMD